MGILQSIRNALSLSDFSPVSGWQDSTSIGSPWITGAGLAPVVIAGDLAEIETLSLAKAMSVPPVARAVMTYSTAMAGLELVPAGPGAEWVNTTSASAGCVSTSMRNVQLMQDIFWARHACLWVTRDQAGHVTDAVRLPLERWSLDEAGNVLLEGRLLDQKNFVYIPGLLPIGFLDMAGGSIKHYLGLIATITSRSRNPLPLVDIHVDEDCTLDDDELEQVRDNWAAARRNVNGAVAVSPKGVTVKPVASNTNEDGAMLIQARNAARLDVANLANLPADMLDGNNGTSGTYENTLQVTSEFIKLSLPFFTQAIEQRLSLDDVTPAGTTVRFNLEALEQLEAPAAGNTGTATPAPATTTEETA